MDEGLLAGWLGSYRWMVGWLSPVLSCAVLCCAVSLCLLPFRPVLSRHVWVAGWLNTHCQPIALAPRSLSVAFMHSHSSVPLSTGRTAETFLMTD